MMRQLSRKLARILTLVLYLSCINPIYAQQNEYIHRVTSLVADASGNLIDLGISGGASIPPPTIHYLSGSYGEAILVADFSGLFWSQMPCAIPVHKNGIRQIRIGQLQTNPPLLRVTIVADQVQRLADVAFKSSSGSLIVRWFSQARGVEAANDQTENQLKAYGELGTFKQQEPNDKSAGDDPDSVPQKESTANRSKWKAVWQHLWRHVDTASSGEAAKQENHGIQQKIASDHSLSGDIRRQRLPKHMFRLDQPNKPAYAQASRESILNQVNGQASGQVPRLILDGKDPVRLEVISNRALLYKSFRLHDPERFVIDLKDVGQLAVPANWEAGTNLRNIRLGHPENDPSTTRLVLDLQDDNVEVKETSTAGKIAFSVSHGVSLFSLMSHPVSVVLDAGHGGSDPGAQRGDIQEKEITLGIVSRTKRMLEESGVKVITTRVDDSTVSLEDRVAITNSVMPNLFLSVHINSLESDSEIHGIETYYQTKQSQAAAQAIHGTLVTGLAVPDRKVRKARFYVVNHTQVPAVLAEVGFISNRQERSKLISSDYQEQVALSLARGVILYLSENKNMPDLAGKVPIGSNAAISNHSIAEATLPAKAAHQ